MRSADLSVLIDTHGPALEAWPQVERRAARELLATSEDARALLARAAAMERALRGPLAGEDDVSSDRVDRVIALTLARTREHTQTVPARRSVLADAVAWLTGLGEGWGRYAMPMALGAVLGVVVGQVSIDATGASGQEVAGVTALLDAVHGDTGWFGS